ncbi:MAG TPA: hypothetical protein VFQ89_00195 [Candidatus Binatia bacterium]|nr:hypothetical protein [Candidatus Binatia bacterium]
MSIIELWGGLANARPPEKITAGCVTARRLIATEAPPEEIVETPVNPVIATVAAPAPTVVVISAPTVARRTDRFPAKPAVLAAAQSLKTFADLAMILGHFSKPVANLLALAIYFPPAGAGTVKPLQLCAISLKLRLIPTQFGPVSLQFAHSRTFSPCRSSIPIPLPAAPVGIR